jgi:hypothetical protein
MLVFGVPHRPRTSECLDPGLLQIDEPLQFISSDLPVQVQPCACEANGVQRLAAQLRQARQHVLDACPCLGNVMIAPLLGRRDWLVLLPLCWICMGQPCLLSLALCSPLTKPLPARMSQFVLAVEIEGVVFTCRAHLDLAHQPSRRLPQDPCKASVIRSLRFISNHQHQLLLRAISGYPLLKGHYVRQETDGDTHPQIPRVLHPEPIFERVADQLPATYREAFERGLLHMMPFTLHAVTCNTLAGGYRRY